MREVSWVMAVKLLLRFRRKLEKHGVRAALLALALKAINSLILFRILRGVYVEQPSPEYLKCPRDYAPGFLPAPALRAYAEDPGTELSQRFLDEALRRGDECYAIRAGEALAAYGWYSFEGTPIGIADLVLRFSPRYVYMYKGFTDPRYRGKRLHAIGMTRALAHYRGKDYRGLVSYVEADNFESLKSCFRMGYRVFGSVYVISAFGRTFTLASAGCRRFEFRLESAGNAGAALSFGKKPG